MREAASRSFWAWSLVPYGYNSVLVQDGAKKRPKLEPDEVTAPVVRHLLELADTGRGMLEMAPILNNEGIANAAQWCA